MQATGEHEVDPHHACLDIAQSRGRVHRYATGSADWRRRASTADNHRSDKGDQLIDQISVEKRAEDGRAAFDQHRIDTAFGEQAQQCMQVDAAVTLRQLLHFGAGRTQRGDGVKWCLIAHDDERRPRCFGLEHDGIERHPRPAVEHDTQRVMRSTVSAFVVGETGREHRIIGQHRADPDQNRIV